MAHLSSFKCTAAQLRPSAFKRVFFPNCSRAFSQTSRTQAKKPRRRAIHDPYFLAQSRQRKAANIAKQADLRKARQASLGDPIRGTTTPFLQSLEDEIPTTAESFLNPEGTNDPSTQRKPYLNYNLTPAEVNDSVRFSNDLIEPVAQEGQQSQFGDDLEAQAERHRADHSNAVEAIRRIVQLENGSSAAKTRAQIERCIETFGRHNTDKFLRPKSSANNTAEGEGPLAEKTPRIGRDTGSSEVQIAMLTHQIRKLADHLARRDEKGKLMHVTDQFSKRSIRLLVHKRQKHLKYLRRSDKGMERWQRVVNLLGLQDASWKGEITV